MQTMCNRRWCMIRLRRRELHSKEKRANTPATGKGSGKTTPEGGAGLSSLGRCKVAFKKEAKVVRVRRTDRRRPLDQEAKDT